jgi:hypothetical protein
VLLLPPAPAATASIATGLVLLADTATAVPGRYLVALKDGSAPRQTAARAGELSNVYHGNLRHVLERTLHGFSVAMTPDQAARLAADPEVDYVEQVQTVQETSTQSNPPWNLDRIDQRSKDLDAKYSYDKASSVTAYIIDSGIRTTNGEFEGRARSGRDLVDDDADADDCRGHGTEMASLVGGRRYGVAKDVNLVAVRVLGCDGKGTTDDLAAGIEWVTNDALTDGGRIPRTPGQRPAKPTVVNVSIGFACPDGGYNCDLSRELAIDNAIAASINAGLAYAVGAGNENLDACNAPIANTQAAVTVGASDENDVRYVQDASRGSNFGPCVDIWAPGTNIEAAGLTGSPVGSGTSEASAQVTGAMALILGRRGWANATPAQVTNELVNTMATNNAVIAGGGSTSKLLYTAPPPVEGGSPIALARTKDGRLQLFGVNDAGQLFTRSQMTPGVNDWSGWLEANATGWYSVAAEANASGAIELFGLRRKELDVVHRRQSFVDIVRDAWLNWSLFAGTRSAAAAARTADGRLQLFAADPAAGQLLHRLQTASNSSTWSDWAVVDPLVQVRAVAAETNGNGQVELFGTTSSGKITHSWSTSGSAWAPFGQLDDSDEVRSLAVARNSDGRLRLYATFNGGQVRWRAQRTSGSQDFDNWRSLGTTTLNWVAADTNADGRIEVFGVDRAGRIWHTWQTTAGTDTYAPWTAMDGQLRS